MEDLLQELQSTLIHEIPITEHLGVQVDAYDQQGLTLSAPLLYNINHKGTAFAGSLNALATLAGWGQFWLILKELKLSGKIVIQDSTCRYLLPVTADFTASCAKPSIQHIYQLEQTLRKKGKARLELTTTIQNKQKVAVRFSGRYVVHLRTADLTQ